MSVWWPSVIIVVHILDFIFIYTLRLCRDYADNWDMEISLHWMRALQKLCWLFFTLAVLFTYASSIPHMCCNILEKAFVVQPVKRKRGWAIARNCNFLNDRDFIGMVRQTMAFENIFVQISWESFDVLKFPFSLFSVPYYPCSQVATINWINYFLFSFLSLFLFHAQDNKEMHSRWLDHWILCMERRKSGRE